MESINEVAGMFKKCERKKQVLKPYNQQTFGERLKSVVLSRYTSIDKCKQLTGITSLDAYISGKSAVGYYVMQDLTNELKVAPSYLFGLSDKNNYNQKKAGYVRIDWIFQHLTTLYPKSTIAYDIGSYNKTINDYISGKTVPTHTKMYNLAKSYCLDIDCLYGYFY